MGIFLAEQRGIPAGDDAYRAYLISRNPSPIVYHSHAMHLKRLRVLVRQTVRQIGAACKVIHRAIVAAKMRRIQRELMLCAGSRDDWLWEQGVYESRDRDRDASKVPQRPLTLGDKWDF